MVGLLGVAALDLIRKRIGVRRDYESLYSLGIAFTAFAAAEAVHGSGFIAAFAAGMTIAVGSVGTPGTWRAFYMYQYVERDAVVGAYNTDDWWFHSRYRGHRAGVAVTLLRQVYVQGAFMLQRRLDLQRYLNRITVDLVKLF